MCLEDIRLGRKLAGVPQTVRLALGAATPLATQNEKRTRLIVCWGGGSNVNIAPAGMFISGTQGIQLSAAYPVFTGLIEEWGPLLTSPWVGFDTAGGTILSIVDCSLGET